MYSQNLLRLRCVSNVTAIYTLYNTDFLSFFYYYYSKIANVYFFLKMKASLENVSNIHTGLMISVIIDL